MIKILNAHSTASIVRPLPRIRALSGSSAPFWTSAAVTSPRSSSPTDTTRHAPGGGDSYAITACRATKIWVELHNEPNLTQEGLGASWADGRAFWRVANGRSSASQIRSAGREVHLPGPSPGGDVPGVRANSARFLPTAQRRRRRDAIGVHCYWANGWPMSGALLHLDNHKYLNRPVWVTEASRNDRPSLCRPRPTRPST